MTTVHPVRGLTLVGVVAGSVLLAACTQTTSAPVEPAPAATTPAQAATVDEDIVAPSPEPEVPDTATQALAVAAAGCLSGFMFDEPTFYGLAVQGPLLRAAIDDGVIRYPGKDLQAASMTSLQVWQGNFTTQAFQTAATLDAAYEPFATLWDKAVTKSLRAWDRGGVTLGEASRQGDKELGKLTARCRVPVAQATELAQSSGAPSLEGWARTVAGSMMPPAWEQPEFGQDPANN